MKASRCLRAVAVAAAAVAASSPSAAQEATHFGRIAAVPVPRGHGVRAALLADVDGDGRDDLVLSTRRAGRRSARTLRVHLRKGGEVAFAAEPDATLDVYEDVVAFAVADVDPEPGAEVVLFTPGTVRAWRTRAPEERRFERLLTADFLFQAPDPKEVFAFAPAVQDVDGDGLADLVVPEPGAYRVALQRREKDVVRFEAPSVLRVPADGERADARTAGARRVQARATRKQISVAVRLGGSDATSDLLAVDESVPAPQLADFDGDGRRDVLAQTPNQLHVWLQREGRTFGAAPDASYDLPFAADRSRRLDVSYSAQTADVDGDRRADVVLFAGDREADALRTQVLLYTQGRSGTPESPLFGKDGVPAQVLVVAGFAGAPRLLDVDGDGRPDLTAGSVRLDAFDAVAAAAKGSLDAELYVYRNRGGTFSRAPDLAHAVSLPAEGFKHRGESLLAEFVPDLTGDGVRDLLLRDQPTRVRLHALRPQRGGALQVAPTPVWEAFVPADAAVHVRERDARTPPELLLVEDAQVRHVRFR